jgi:hypothetical protein
VSLNAVYLIGLVATRPRLDPERRRCSLRVITASSYGHMLERHRVVAETALAEVAAALAVGQQVFVVGSLRRDRARRHNVFARDVWALSVAPDAPLSLVPSGTHASPRGHRRTGHWRRVGLGTAREHLVWVRATTVGGHRG